jgi:hypothetical protein
MSIIEGTVIRFYTSQPFETVDGTPADPTEVIFAYQVGAGSVTQLKYAGASSGMNKVIRNSTGSYHVDVDTTDLPGNWQTTWVGLSTDGSVQARAELTVSVVPGSIQITP